MSLNVSGNKYIKVYNPKINFNYSDRVVFADLVSSRKTGNPKVDKETGQIIVNNETGEEVPERAYSRWEGKFVGDAFEAAKGLRDGATIDIVKGWVTYEPRVSTRNGRTYYNAVVTITEFMPSDIAEGVDANTEDYE